MDSVALEKVVATLADQYEWNWTRQGLSERAAADAVLSLMARHGLIQQRHHRLGGLVWKVNESLYGRTDGVTLDNFEALKP